MTRSAGPDPQIRPSASEVARPARRIRGLDADQRREERRRAVLDAALGLFEIQGYAATSIEQICQTAYVSTKSFYALFAGREACYHALFTECTEALQREMLARLETLPDDEGRATELLLDGFVEAVASDSRRAHLLLGRGRLLSPEVELMRRENRRWAAAFVSGIWRRFGVAGDPTAIAVALIGGMFDLITVWLIDGDLGDPPQVSRLREDLGRFYRAVRGGLSSATERGA